MIVAAAVLGLLDQLFAWGIRNLINMVDCNKYNSSYMMRIPFLGWEYREKAIVSQIETTTYVIGAKSAVDCYSVIR